MKKESVACQKKQLIQVNRVAYFLYMILVAYLLLQGNIEWAVINMGIALVFDPFDANVTWKDRPTYQRAWLLIHLALTFAGFIYLILHHR